MKIYYKMNTERLDFVLINVNLAYKDVHSSIQPIQSVAQTTPTMHPILHCPSSLPPHKFTIPIKPHTLESEPNEMLHLAEGLLSSTYI